MSVRKMMQQCEPNKLANQTSFLCNIYVAGYIPVHALQLKTKPIISYKHFDQFLSKLTDQFSSMHKAT